MDNIRVYVDHNTNSANPLERFFCGVCGSPVAIRTPLQPGMVFVPSGTLEGQELHNHMPQSENFVGDRVTWFSGGVADANQMAGRKGKR